MTLLDRRVGAAALLAVTVATACSSSDPDVQTYTDRDSTITVDEDERFSVRLESNETTGYEWKVSQLPAALRLVDSRSERPDGAAPGAPGHQVFEFEARDTGTTTLELSYLRPFEENEPPAKTASFEVVVR